MQEEKERYESILSEAYKNAEKEDKSYNRDWLDSPWSGAYFFFLLSLISSAGIVFLSDLNAKH